MSRGSRDSHCSARPLSPRAAGAPHWGHSSTAEQPVVGRKDAGATPAGLVHRSARAGLRRARGAPPPRAGGGADPVSSLVACITTERGSERRSCGSGRMGSTGLEGFEWRPNDANMDRPDAPDDSGLARLRSRDPRAAGKEATWVVDGEERCTGMRITTPRRADPAPSQGQSCSVRVPSFRDATRSDAWTRSTTNPKDEKSRSSVG